MTEQTLQAKKDFSRIGLSLFVVGIVSTVMQVLLALAWNTVLRSTPLGDQEIMLWILTFGPIYLFGIPAGLLVMKKVPRETAEVQKLGFMRFWTLMLMCMPIMYGGNLIGTALSGFFSGGSAENPLMEYVMGNPLYSFLVTVILAPCIEEYLFRRQIIDRVSKYGEKAAMLFSALTFGLFHMNLFQFFYAFGLGLLFAYVYIRTRALRYSIFMHMIINCLGSVIAPMLLSNLDMSLLTEIEAGTATAEQIMQFAPALAAFFLYAFVLIAAVVGGLILLLRQWGKHQFSPAQSPLPPKTAGKTLYLNVGMILFTAFCLIMMGISLI